MIIDLEQFLHEGQPRWRELEGFLERVETYGAPPLDVAEIRRFHYLYERASADLAEIASFTFERDARAHLEALVARAYAAVHESRDARHRLALKHAFFHVFPNTFRRRIGAFQIACIATLVGACFGALALALDGDAKAVLIPAFPHLAGSPSDRVAEEEAADPSEMRRAHAQGVAFYFTHNTRVSIFVMALGLTWGVGSIILLFYNGVILGAVCADYVLAGESVFLAGWLLPHGAVEIPAILVAGQAGLLLGSALIGWGTRHSLSRRLREIAPDLVTLIAGVAVMLLWAGLIESCLSQYHAPIFPYAAKIGIGVVELLLLTAYLARAGRGPVPEEPDGS